MYIQKGWNLENSYMAFNWREQVLFPSFGNKNVYFILFRNLEQILLSTFGNDMSVNQPSLLQICETQSPERETSADFNRNYSQKGYLFKDLHPFCWRTFSFFVQLPGKI